MNFTFFANQRLYFGPGSLHRLPELAAAHGPNLLLITGSASFLNSPHWPELTRGLAAVSVNTRTAAIHREPAPADIDAIVDRFRNRSVDVVAAIGGGSVLDAGKAVSAMLLKPGSVTRYLEGVGDKVPDGKKLPFIAAPTTAGTGSEATKNAVITQPGEFKKSLRHDAFVPDAAIVDPALTLGCSPDITAACGMDALTQLLESLVSTGSSPYTDALALSGLAGLGDALALAAAPGNDASRELDARTRLSYASYLSGLTLANAGLGTVHGFAAVIGGMVDIPHGVVCGTLMAETFRQTVLALAAADPGHPALAKLEQAGRLMGMTGPETDTKAACLAFCDRLAHLTRTVNIPGLGQFGVTADDIPSIVSRTGQKNNPARLSPETLTRILHHRLSFGPDPINPVHVK